MENFVNLWAPIFFTDRPYHVSDRSAFLCDQPLKLPETMTTLYFVGDDSIVFGILHSGNKLTPKPVIRN